MTAVALVSAVVGLFVHFLPYVATLLYLGRIVLLLAKRNLTHGAQLWLVKGNPLDPIRAWTRRTMLSVEDNYLNPKVFGQTARVVLTDPRGNIITNPTAYEALHSVLAPQFHQGGYVSSDERLRLVDSYEPTIISGGVGSTSRGSHMVLYVLGVGQQTLAEVEYALRIKYLQDAVNRVAARVPDVANVRVYFEIDPELYDCRINDADTRYRFWNNIHD